MRNKFLLSIIFVFVNLSSAIGLDFYEGQKLLDIVSEAVVKGNHKISVNPWKEGDVEAVDARYRNRNIVLFYSMGRVFCVHAAAVDYCIDLDGDGVIDLIQSEFMLPYGLFKTLDAVPEPEVARNINRILDACHFFYIVPGDPAESKAVNYLESLFSEFYQTEESGRELAYYIYFDLFYAKHLRPDKLISFYGLLRTRYKEYFNEADRYILFRVFETSFLTRKIHEEGFQKLYSWLTRVYSKDFLPFRFYRNILEPGKGYGEDAVGHWFWKKYSGKIKLLPSTLFSPDAEKSYFHVTAPL